MLNVPSQSFPAPSSQQRLSTGAEKKITLKPGRSLMSWLLLTEENKNLNGLKGRLIEVTEEELAKHNQREDCWMCIRGNVYNVTPYMEYHPGGEKELMRSAGADGTDLFDQAHHWVNYGSLLKECLVGRISIKPTASSKELLLERPGEKEPLTELLLERPGEKEPLTVVPEDGKLVESFTKDFPPCYDWFQTGATVTVAIYTKQKDFESEMVNVDLEGSILRAEIMIKNYSYLLYLDLNHTVQEEITVNITGNVGKIEIVIKKQDCITWAILGQPLDDHSSFITSADRGLFYRKCKLISKSDVNYNTRLFCFLLPNGTFLQVPIGQHVYLKHTIAGMEMVKPYTVVSSSLQWNAQEPPPTDSRKIFLMIKIYPNGAFTPHIDSLQIGDYMYVSSPQGSFRKSQVEVVEDLFLLAAGTGFAPMVTLLNHVLTNICSLRKVRLMFFNRKEEDILWRCQLKQLVLQDTRCEVQYVLSEPTEEWTGMRGHISLPLLTNFVIRSKEKSKALICICGPTMFTSKGIRFLECLGFSEEEVYAFTE